MFDYMRKEEDRTDQTELMPRDGKKPRPKKEETNYNFTKYDLHQTFLLPPSTFLLPPSIDDWVPQNSPARFILATINRLEEQGKLDRFYRKYREDGWGATAYHPKMMVATLLYCFSHGIISSRKIAKAMESRVEVRFLSGNVLVDFRTIAKFRIRHGESLEDLFIEILSLCEVAGLAKLGRVALDGTKVKANASLQRSQKRETLARKVRDILEKARKVDEEEDRLHGERRGDELPDELATEQGRQKVIDEAISLLEQEEAEGEVTQSTDPANGDENANATLTRQEVVQLGYLVNAYEQAGLKEQKAREEQQTKIDQRERTEAETGKKIRGRKPKLPDEIEDRDAKGNITDPDSRIMLTRSGAYIQGYNAQVMVDCDSQVIVAFGVTNEENDLHQLIPMMDRCLEQSGDLPQELVADAGYFTNRDVAMNIGGSELYINTKKGWKLRQELRGRDPPRGRIPKDMPLKERMERRLMTKKGQRVYRDRFNVEAVYGQMKNRGQVGFLRKGLEKSDQDWALSCSGHNLMKMYVSDSWIIEGGVLRIVDNELT
jgi:transposase